MSEDAFDITEQIACVKREIGMRVNVYPRWIALGRMTQGKADREIAIMRDVLRTLERVKSAAERLGNPQPF